MVFLFVFPQITQSALDHYAALIAFYLPRIRETISSGTYLLDYQHHSVTVFSNTLVHICMQRSFQSNSCNSRYNTSIFGNQVF